MANERSASRRIDGGKSNYNKSNNKNGPKKDFKSGAFRDGPKKDYKSGSFRDGPKKDFNSGAKKDFKSGAFRDGPKKDYKSGSFRDGPKTDNRAAAKRSDAERAEQQNRGPDGFKPRRRIKGGPGGPETRPQLNKAPGDGRIRLNKFLAECGIASRRAADQIIAEGEITINGKKVFELGVKVHPREDRILYKGKPLNQQTQFVYYAFNKPKSVVTSTVDPQGRPTVIDFFPKSRFRLFPVGRLDWDSEGLLLITNDGEFANRVIHPDAHVPKTYHVKLDGIPTDIHLDKLKKGVSTVGGKVAALHVRRLAKSTDKKGWIEISIGEGKNHQIKNMFAKIGFDVVKLRRVAIGEFKLGNLEPGKSRELTFEDLDKIFKKRKPKEDDSE